MLDSLTMTPFDPAQVEHELHGYLTNWPSLAQAHPAQTRQILRKLLPSRIRVWREVRGGEGARRPTTSKGRQPLVDYSTA